MINRKPIVSTIVSTVFLSILIISSTISSATDNTFNTPNTHKNFSSAQVHEHEKNNREKSKHKKAENKHSDHDCMGEQKIKDYAYLFLSNAETLALTDEQLGKIARIHLKYAHENKQAKQKAHKKMMAFTKASLKPSTSEAKLRKLGTEHTQAFNTLIELHINERKAVHKVLTVDQINKLKTMKIHHTEDSDHEDGKKGCCNHEHKENQKGNGREHSSDIHGGDGHGDDGDEYGGGHEHKL